MLVAALTPVREWSSVGRISVGSNGLGTAPIGNMAESVNMSVRACAIALLHVPSRSVLPASTRFIVALVTAVLAFPALG